ncbi:MAG: hypothetical protein P1U56_14400 [Saprospiraceae bacterium]|nr:hypothetical protein [Saprospiraceae bacterium]
MDHAVLQKEDENKKKGIIMSFMVHALLLLIALIPYLASENPPKELSGIVVAFGAPDGGSSNANPLANTTELDVQDTPKEDDSQDNKETSTSPNNETDTKDPAPSEPSTSDLEPVSSTSDVTVADKQKDDQKKAEAAEAERLQRQAEERARIEAQKEAEAKAKKAAYDQSKSKFSDLLGTGKGNNNNDGNQGDPKGDPNSDALNQVATGSGRIGGGLSNRGVVYEPEIEDQSQYTGIVVVKVCVNSTGKVVEAKYTQMGSTTTNKILVDLAVNGAKKYTFTESDVEMQCGNITIEFRVK